MWGSGEHVAVALHGITASAMSWQAVARHMPTGWMLAAPDLRGRGHSRDLPGPYGLDRHVADVTAVLRHFSSRPVLAGHSMGAYAALLTRDAHPSLIRRLVALGLFDAWDMGEPAESELSVCQINCFLRFCRWPQCSRIQLKSSSDSVSLCPMAG